MRESYAEKSAEANETAQLLAQMQTLVHKLEDENETTHEALQAAHTIRQQVGDEARQAQREIAQLTQDLADEKAIDGRTSGPKALTRKS